MNTLISVFFKTIFSMFILMVWVPIVSASELGDVAPEPEISHWVGEKPNNDKFGDGKTIFVLEFWSTECSYCAENIPRLNDIQARYKNKGVVVIGIAKDDLKDVEEFVKDNDFGYLVAMDNENETTTEKYITGFGIEGIPYLFIINKEGLVAWHGHPEDEVDRVLDELIDGQYDLQAAIKRDKAQKLVAGYIYMATQTDEHNITKDIGKRVLYHGNDDFPLLTEFVWVLINDTEIRKRDLPLALEVIKRAYALTGGIDSTVLNTYADVLEMMEKPDKAKPFREKAAKLTPPPEDNKDEGISKVHLDADKQ